MKSINPILRNILAVIGGVFAGGMLNSCIIMLSQFIIPPPPGADLTTEEGLIASMHLMQPQHFLMPFLAHSLGTLLAAWIAAKFVSSHQLVYGLCIGGLFLIGGVMGVMMLPSPLWFSVTDLVFAYLPMGYLGVYLSGKMSK